MAAQVRTLVPLLLFVALFPVLAASQTILPLTESDHTYFVIAKINGHDTLLLLDTGARNSVVRPEVIQRAGIVPTPGAKLSGLTGQNVPISQAPVQIEIVPHNVVYLHVGVAKLPEYMKGCEGVIGNDVLSKFSRVLIDYKAHTLTVWQ